MCVALRRVDPVALAAARDDPHACSIRSTTIGRLRWQSQSCRSGGRSHRYRSTPHYDAITERLRAESPIDGLRVHTAGFYPQGFRIFEVWEAQEHFERFLRDRLGPLIGEVGGGDAAQPETKVHELHAFVAP